MGDLIMSKNNDLLDIMKLAMAIGVVAIHTNVYILKTLGRLAVPFFLVTSSYLFFLKYNSLSKQQQDERLKKYLKRLLFLFMSWELFYIPVALKKAITFFQDNSLNPISIAKYIFYFLLYKNELTGWGASWYLLALLWALPIFCYMVRHFNIKVVFALCVLIEIYYVISSGYNTVFHVAHPVSPLFFPRTFIYIYIGYVCTKMKVKSISPSKIMILVILFLIENSFIHFALHGSINSEEVILTSITATSIVIFCLSNKMSFENAHLFRRYSTFLYAGHGLILEILNHLIKLNAIWLFSMVIVISIFCFASWLYLTKILGNRMTFLKYMS